MFQFYMNTRIRFGVGCRRELPSILSSEGWSHLGVVVDHGLKGVAVVEELIESLEHAEVSWCRVCEPSYDALEDLRTGFTARPLDAIVGIGGGSALDMAKAMAVLVNNREPAVHYRGFDMMTEPVLPIVCVPTTAGTGSEVTPNASFVDMAQKKKMGINGEAVRPRYGVLDPELTLSCPPAASASAGVDSVVHATEAYVAKKTNPMARFFALEGIRLVSRSLRAVMKDGADLDARTEVMYGAFLAGIALMNSGTGPAAAMSYPLGVHHGVPHGVGGGLFLPHVADQNVAEGYHQYADLYRSVDEEAADSSDHEAAQAFVAYLERLWSDVGVEPDLRSLSLSEDQKERFVADTMELKGALDQNPTPFGEAEVRAMLTKLTD